MANTVLTPPELDPKNDAEPIFGTELQKTEESVFASLWASIKDVFFPEKLPPLELQSKPVAVVDRMAVKRDPTSTGIAVGLHILVFLIIFWIVKNKVVQIMAKPIVTSIDMSKVPPPISMKKASERMGGGGGQRGPTPVTKGALPKFAEQQIVPPNNHPPLSEPKINIQPTVEVQKDLKMSNVNMPNFGMPNAPTVGVASLGNGSGTGIGSGRGSGIGPGEGGNYGGGIRHVGNGVLAPQLIYGPEPEFSEEARKAKFQGEVIVSLVVDTQGRPQRVRVPRPVGMGLDEKAIEAVKQYKFKPATENGVPVAVELAVAVNFQIF
ncbi:energy transducer TonB [Terriglobus tenax]|uniref:energy transducer TonB n=1 Tax=Terriglobus tenax TaxID=1111115 RepID=UPI0021E00F79|nr:energy transducer TonB [Terriglobus tenax]